METVYQGYSDSLITHFALSLFAKNAENSESEKDNANRQKDVYQYVVIAYNLT